MQSLWFFKVPLRLLIENACIKSLIIASKYVPLTALAV